MLSTRIKKVIKDFTTRWGRTSLTFAGLVLGLFGVGSVLTAFVILSDDLEANFTQTNPPHIVADMSDIPSDLANRMANIPGAEASEQRRRVITRVEVQPDLWRTMVVFVVEDFDNIEIAKFYPESGAWPATRDGFLMERDGRFFYQGEFGDVLTIRLPDGQMVEAAYQGQVFDPGVAPSRMERFLYGYVSRETYDGWNLTNPTARVLLRASNPDSELDVAQRAALAVHGPGSGDTGPTIWDVADHLTPVLEYYDEELYGVEVLDGVSHPHQFQMDSILALLLGLLVVSFLLSAALIINLTDSILAGEVKNIGIIKSIGGNRKQIMRDYLLGMALLGGLAAAMGVTMATRFGYGIANFIAFFLNFEILTQSLPIWLVPTLIFVGMVIPFLVAYRRVGHVADTSIREALQGDQDLSVGSRLEEAGKALSFLPLIPRMALRNLLRRPRRASLTVLTVSIGLLFFVTALNMRSSLLSTIDEVKLANPNDLSINFTSHIPVSELEDWITEFPNIAEVEYWQARTTSLAEIQGRRSNPTVVTAIPTDTTMFAPDMLEGNWLNPDRPAGIVVTQRMTNSYEHIELGGAYEMTVGDWTGNVEIVGVIKDFMGGRIYASSQLTANWTDEVATSNLMMVRLDVSSIETQAQSARAIEASLLGTEWQVSTIGTTALLEQVILNHVDSIAQALMIVALTMLVVGALGLASSIGISVMERYREVGILKAVGGRSGHVLGLFIWEGIFIAVIGWGVALIIAPPLSRAFATTFGTAFVEYPFDYAPALYGAPLALAVALVMAILASFLPAQSATRLPVREAMQSL